MNKYLLAVILTGLGALLVISNRASNRQSAPEEIRTLSPDSLIISPPNKQPAKETPTASMQPRAEALEAPSAVYFSEADLNLIKTEVTEALSFADHQKRLRSFRESGADSPARQQKALAIVIEPYHLPLTREQAEQKVFALEMMSLSQYTRSPDCLTALNDVAQHFDNSKEPDVRGVSGADLLALARICKGIDGSTVERLESTLKGQASARVIHSALEPNSFDKREFL